VIAFEKFIDKQTYSSLIPQPGRRVNDERTAENAIVFLTLIRGREYHFFATDAVVVKLNGT